MTMPPSVVRATLAVTCRGVGDREIETTVSTASTDRMNDQITQNWDLTAYRRNPVVFWNHRTQDLPIARSVWIGVVNGHLQSRDQFPPVGMYPFADIVHDMARAGFINAKSVGFKPMKWVHNEQRGGIDYLESELLEHSYVGLPANAEALIAGRTADRAAVEKWLGRSPQIFDDDGEPVLHIRDDTRRRIWRSWEPAAEPVLLIEDDTESVLKLVDDTVHVDLNDLRAAFTQVVTETIVAEFGRRRGNPDYCASRLVGRGRR